MKEMVTAQDSDCPFQFNFDAAVIAYVDAPRRADCIDDVSFKPDSFLAQVAAEHPSVLHRVERSKPHPHYCYYSTLFFTKNSGSSGGQGLPTPDG